MLLKLLLTTALYVSLTSSSVPVIDSWGRCGPDIAGRCTTGTECSTGVPSFCVPIQGSNSSLVYNEVTGYGRPVYPAPDQQDDDPIPVFIVCTDANFSGYCVEWSLACDFCAVFGSDLQDDISSVEMLNTEVGCNFWVSDDCVGNGINVDSGAIYDLSATDYNDVIVAFNCYLTGR